jgi:hypothetical protein
MAGHRMSRVAAVVSWCRTLVGVAARANNQFDASCGTDRRHTWSGRNSVGGQRQRRNRKRAENPQDCYTHINLLK